MAEVTKLQTQRQVTDALWTRNGLSTDDIRMILLSSDILVQQVHEKSQNEPYKLLAIKGEIATIKLLYGLIAFRMINIKQYTSNDNKAQA